MNWYRKAAALGDAHGQMALGTAYLQGCAVSKDDAEAIHWLSKAAASTNTLTPATTSMTYNGLAWALATFAKGNLRDGSKAVALAEQAVTLTKRNNPAYLDTLAAAYAETGQFEKAVATEEEAMTVLKSDQKIAEYAAHLALFRERKPCREK